MALVLPVSWPQSRPKRRRRLVAVCRVTNLLRALSTQKRVARTVLFLQAGDGIRGTSVTGVQTCALPICRRVDLPGRRNESGEPVVSLVTARAALRAFRRRHTHRAGIGRADDWLAIADFRLANHVHHRWVRRAGVVGALVPGNPGANARHVGERRAHSYYLGPVRDPVAQQ